jgi:two-component system cell cycle sensor histidine kinase/response regulator CckA
MLGPDLARQMLDARPDLRVIYMSGYAEPILTTNKTLPPGVTLLSKPLPEPLLLNAIRQVVDDART